MNVEMAPITFGNNLQYTILSYTPRSAHLLKHGAGRTVSQPVSHTGRQAGRVQSSLQVLGLRKNGKVITVCRLSDHLRKLNSKTQSTVRLLNS
jgi:hypothetical protein